MVMGMSYGKKLALVVLSASFGMLGCTTTSKNVPARYVPPTQYQAYNCKQLAVEFQRKQTRIEEIAGQLDEKASKDQLVGTFGAVVFFPVLFMLGGNPLLEDEYAGLVGEAEAMQQAAFQKRCTNPEVSSPSARLR
jgi:hypothetical protein